MSSYETALAADPEVSGLIDGIAKFQAEDPRRDIRL